MATLKEQIIAVLETDAQLTGGTNLGDYLGKTANEPYGIYYIFPGDNPEPPFITAGITSQTNDLHFERNILLTITAFGANFEAVLQQVKTLLEGWHTSSTDDYECISCQWENSGPELWEDQIKTYYRADTYRIKAIL